MIADLREQLAIAQACTVGSTQPYSGQQWTRSLCESGEMGPALSLHGHTSMVNRVAVLRKGLIASCSDDKSVKIWQIADMGPDKPPEATEVCALTGHTHWVNDVIAVNDSMLATASSDKTVRLWRYNLSGEATEVSKLVGHEGSVRSLCMIDEGLLASASADKVVKVS